MDLYVLSVNVLVRDKDEEPVQHLYKRNRSIPLPILDCFSTCDVCHVIVSRFWAFVMHLNLLSVAACHACETGICKFGMGLCLIVESFLGAHRNSPCKVEHRSRLIRPLRSKILTYKCDNFVVIAGSYLDHDVLGTSLVVTLLLSNEPAVSQYPNNDRLSILSFVNCVSLSIL